MFCARRGLRNGLKIRTPQVHLVRLHVAGRREVRKSVQIAVKGKQGKYVVILGAGSRRATTGQHRNIYFYNAAFSFELLFMAEVKSVSLCAHSQL